MSRRPHFQLEDYLIAAALIGLGVLIWQVFFA